jgi:hypothetical protein
VLRGDRGDNVGDGTVMLVSNIESFNNSEENADKVVEVIDSLIPWFGDR